ncbi:MAG: hypothetical protein J5725_01935 [Bacteroidales bacterium]|nr:hypothetical protein [Bacteroidales bacterium]
MIFSLGNYNTKLREYCHNVKENDFDTIVKVANLLSAKVNKNDILVPIPNHQGYAVYTLAIANEIAKNVNCKVYNCIKGVQREKLYTAKQRNAIVDLGLYLSLPQPKTNIILLDNVIATGYTYKEAKKLFVSCDLLTIAKV